MEGNVGLAFLLTAGAGLSTVLGSLIGLAVRKPGPGFMSFTLGFSAGVMVLVSFVELLPGSIESLGFLSAHVAFFAGMAAFFLIDFLIPHDYVGQEDRPPGQSAETLKRTGLLVAVGIGIHNLPEGMATFAAALEDVHLGVAIAVAIAIHNIPEGLAVSAPVYAATGSRGKGFLWSFLSGVSEPLGAGLAAVVLLPFLTPAVLGWVLGGVAGIMVAIALDELVPAAKAYGSAHTPIAGIMAGMVVMAASLWLLG
ncbi:MAG: zinc transporter ZupT [Armatimonadota bacterium]|jgi:ZIP family zinc transporter